jgi:3-isopropylmalate dehydrogenase
MLRYSFALPGPAKTIENAVSQVIADGYRTADLWGPADAKHRRVDTAQMGDAVAEAVARS